MYVTPKARITVAHSPLETAPSLEHLPLRPAVAADSVTVLSLEGAAPMDADAAT